MRIAIALALSMLLIPGGTRAVADDLPASVDRGKELLAEGDKLADEKETTEAVLRYKLAFEQLLPGLRHLRFKSEVKRDVTNREDLRAFLIREIDEDMTPAEFKTGELGYKALGLIPRDLNWKDVMVKVYSEEIAAFYDPRTKTMHLIKEPAVEPKKPSFLESLLGIKKGGFDKDENKTVIAHELTHALADQNYDLAKMQGAAKGNDDKSLALSSLIEGEATLAMIGAGMDDWDGSQVKAFPSADLDRIFSFLIPLMPFASGAALREAPPILSESLIFPYLRGMVFCARLTNDGGWKALDEAYEHPPQSTEQILHPEKYRAQPDPPTEVDLGKLDAGEGWTEVGRNVVGEMQIAVLFRRHGGKPVAAGWDGDCFAVFEGPEEKLGLVWLTTWDTEDDAREFARQYARFQTTKLGEGAKVPREFPDAIRRNRDESNFAVERRGQDVAVVEGFGAGTTDRLLDAAFRAKKTELEPIGKK
ncbi:hypothetical protein P12x_003694 [Tundrisphaera lichenicola]|uniref:hypothetical protein n=1 Tax=Tundrisphaera lichenicola TaxID=2029860 RepID=UPI003EB7EF3E